jgi:hypothetical protein
MSFPPALQKNSKLFFIFFNMQYVKKKGAFWVKTSERTGWWIAGKKNEFFIITNGFRYEYVKKELIKTITQTHQATQISNLNQTTTTTTTTTSEVNLNHTAQTQKQTQTKRKRGRPPAPQITCPKCSKTGIIIERLVKSNIYRSIRHKENGKIRECVIQNISKAIYR